MESDTRVEQDPLWLGLCIAAAIGFVVVLLATLADPPGPGFLASQVFIVPLMGVGYARGIRAQGGNSTQFAQELLHRRGSTLLRRHSRLFAAVLVAGYAGLVFLGVLVEGLTANTIGFAVIGGLVTAFVLARTDWASTPAIQPEG